MKKNTVKLLSDIITNEFDNTRDFLLSHKNPVNNDTLKRYVLNIRNNIITHFTINKDIVLTQKEKEFICIMFTSNTIKLVNLINKCSENVSPYYLSIYLNTTRDRCVKALQEYYSEQMHTEITEAIEHLVKLYSDMIS